MERGRVSPDAINVLIAVPYPYDHLSGIVRWAIEAKPYIYQTSSKIPN